MEVLVLVRLTVFCRSKRCVFHEGIARRRCTTRSDVLVLDRAQGLAQRPRGACETPWSETSSIAFRATQGCLYRPESSRKWRPMALRIISTGLPRELLATDENSCYSQGEDERWKGKSENRSGSRCSVESSVSYVRFKVHVKSLVPHSLFFRFLFLSKGAASPNQLRCRATCYCHTVLVE